MSAVAQGFTEQSQAPQLMPTVRIPGSIFSANVSRSIDRSRNIEATDGGGERQKPSRREQLPSIIAWSALQVDRYFQDGVQAVDDAVVRLSVPRGGNAPLPLPCSAHLSHDVRRVLLGLNAQVPPPSLHRRRRRCRHRPAPPSWRLKLRLICCRGRFLRSTANGHKQKKNVRGVEGG